MVKNMPANAGDTEDSGSVPGLGRSPAEGNSNPLQYSCLGNPMSREAWRANVAVHGVTKSWTGLKRRDCSPPGSSDHGDSPGRSSRMGCNALLWGIFPTQESNGGLLLCRQILHQLSHQGSPEQQQKTIKHQKYLTDKASSAFSSAGISDYNTVWHTSI